MTRDHDYPRIALSLVASTGVLVALYCALTYQAWLWILLAVVCASVPLLLLSRRPDDAETGLTSTPLVVTPRLKTAREPAVSAGSGVPQRRMIPREEASRAAEGPSTEPSRPSKIKKERPTDGGLAAEDPGEARGATASIAIHDAPDLSDLPLPLPSTGQHHFVTIDRQLEAVLPTYRPHPLPHGLIIGADAAHCPHLKTIIANHIRGLTTGVRHVIKASSEVHEQTIRAALEKTGLIDRVLECAGASGLRRRITRLLPALVDELVMNAVFNAPVDQHGESRYDQLDRATELKLESEQSAVLSWGADESCFAVSVRDPFGSLTADVLLTYLKHGFETADVRRDTGKGGAGLGLYMVCRSVNTLIVSIFPGVTTEITAIFERGLTPEASKARRVLAIVSQDPATTVWEGRDLRITARQMCRGTALGLIGAIDEAAALTQLSEFASPLLFDLGAVTKITSAGVQRWIDMMADLADVPVTLDHCPVIIVQQMNMIANFRQHAAIRSFFAPYRCETCDRDEDVLLSLDGLERPLTTPPTVPCYQCNHPMAFDDLPSEYFSGLVPQEARCAHK